MLKVTHGTLALAANQTSSRVWSATEPVPLLRRFDCQTQVVSCPIGQLPFKKRTKRRKTLGTLTHTHKKYEAPPIGGFYEWKTVAGFVYFSGFRCALEPTPSSGRRVNHVTRARPRCDDKHFGDFLTKTGSDSRWNTRQIGHLIHSLDPLCNTMTQQPPGMRE